MKRRSLSFKQIFLTVVLIGIVILLLLLLKSCGQRKEENIPSMPARTPEQLILQRMKADEAYLFSLYDAPDICEKEWIKEYRKVGAMFADYQNEYDGNDHDIKVLLAQYAIYGQKIQEIAIFIDQSDYQKGIQQLEELMEAAKENERELQRLYDQAFAK